MTARQPRPRRRHRLVIDVKFDPPVTPKQAADLASGAIMCCGLVVAAQPADRVITAAVKRAMAHIVLAGIAK